MEASSTGHVAVGVRGLTKTFAGTHALQDVTFEVGHGRVHALVGGNGSGKSTVIKILAGVVPADAGTILTSGRELPANEAEPARMRALGLRFVHQDLGVFADLTVAENLALGAGFPTGFAGRVRWTALRKAAQAVLERHHIDVSPDARLGDLRPADKTMIAIARALQDPTAGDGDRSQHVLVLDEPSAALPAAEVADLHARIDWLRAEGHAVLLVSHRLGEIIDIADHVTVLRDGQHRTTRPVAGLGEADLARLIVGRIPITAADVGRETVGTSATRDDLLEVEGLSGGLVADMSFRVHAGEILGLAGLVGSGRSELFDLLTGAVRATAGTVRLHGRVVRLRHPADAIAVGIARVPEDRLAQGVFPDRSLAENLAAARVRRYFRFPAMRRREEQRDALAAIEGPLGITAAGPHAPMWTLSGGNQQKVVVGRWLAIEPTVLLLDEPTQGVDVGARHELHALARAAARRGVAVMVATSDFEELAALADRVVVLAGGRIVDEIAGQAVTPDRCYQLAHAAGGFAHG